MTLYIGIDLGGTKIAGAVWDSELLTVQAQKTIPTQGHLGPDAVLERIAGLVRELGNMVGLESAAIPGVGVGVPATFDMEQGVIWLIPNLPGDWYGKPIVALLREMLGCPVYLVNDARAFTLAEATIGAGRGAASCVGITLGTGIGGGIAINGRLYLGLTGTAGEFGHHSIDMYGAPDGSGNPGGWEGIASGPAIAAMGMKAVAQGITTKIGELVNFDLNQITPEIIARAAEMGDEVAKRILNTAGFYLGSGIANVITMLAPERVIIGGGLARLGEWIMKPIHETLKLRVHTVPLDRVQIILAALGDQAGVIGAAIWASQQGKADQ
ncbi:MAG: ROK family protein [Anaerolineae bacterium]|nr:ROK family protein [Anaerolineae bacterium]